MPDAFWADKQADFQRHMATDEMARFPEWSTVVATMFVGPIRFVDDERDEMRAADPERWSKIPSEIGGYPDTNLAHQSYHLFQWEQATGRRVESLSRIIEVGGGYGAMARVCRGLGFEGEYVIYDLPVLSDLQRYYLRETGAAAECRSEFAADQGDLLIALYSLSEMSLETQGRYLTGLDCRHFLIGTHDALWFGADTNAPLNAHFFHGRRVEHPCLSGRYYLIG